MSFSGSKTMKRLPKAKRNQLIMVVAGTVILISMVYFFLISPQGEKNRALGMDIGSAQTKLDQYRATIKKTDAMNNALNDATLQLAQAEEDIVTGDIYAWTYDTIRRFKTAYRVDILAPSQPTLSDVDLLPAFPYRQAKVTVTGTAYYHDLGKFVMDFENNFPHVRLVNLVMEPANILGSGGEKLSFRMDIVMLVKSSN
jgi:hypothetical protein